MKLIRNAWEAQGAVFFVGYGVLAVGMITASMWAGAVVCGFAMGFIVWSIERQRRSKGKAR